MNSIEPSSKIPPWPFIFVGHSFGGRILEHAVAQGLIGQNAAATAGNVNKPADLTLLLNPASEALSARQLKLALRKWDAPTPPIDIVYLACRMRPEQAPRPLEL